MQAVSQLGMSDRLTMTKVGMAPDSLRLRDTIRDGLPGFGMPLEVALYRLKNLPNMLSGVLTIMIARFLARRSGLLVGYGVLRLRKFCADGRVLDLGVVSHKLITTAGVNKIVALLNGTDATTGTTFKYHGFGTGATAPAIGDTALQTEATTQYNPDSTRPTGSQTTSGSNNVYRSVGTFTPDASYSPTEMGLFSAASAGTLLDRFTFTAVPLNGTGDSLQTTVDITFAAGS